MHDIHVRSYTGSGFRPHLHSVAKLRAEIYEDSNLETEAAYLRALSMHKESIFVLIFDENTLIGCAVGHPLMLGSGGMERPFVEQGLDPHAFFFFGDPLLLNSYRGRGIGHHLFDAREAHVEHLGFNHICLFTQEGEETLLSEDFLRKRGYVHHPELRFLTPMKKNITFWIKPVSHVSSKESKKGLASCVEES
ncbi:MAG: GNAT family N-acetyltransferase [Verrucomicrobia bacterium]|nr:GNAT family N-acetyltransferase [Verrucomicrobiota bacterium]